MRDVGPTPQSLHDLVASHARLALIAIEVHDPAEARQHLAQSTKLLNEVDRLHWTTAKTSAFREGLAALEQTLESLN